VLHCARAKRFLAKWAIGLGILGASCAGPGEYVWFRQLPVDATQAGHEYVIGVGDTVSIRVLGHEDMSVKQHVRADGRLALLLIGEVDAKGKRPSSLKAELEARLKDYIVSPSVAVNVDEEQPLTVLLLGEVQKPGAYPLGSDQSLAHALALGGGLTDYASRSSIFVVRSEPRAIRIRFVYQDIYRDTGGAGAFLLHHGDVVEVE
jgi:polysaccharide export outer membrane protein